MLIRMQATLHSPMKWRVTTPSERHWRQMRQNKTRCKKIKRTLIQYRLTLSLKTQQQIDQTHVYPMPLTRYRLSLWSGVWMGWWMKPQAPSTLLLLLLQIIIILLITRKKMLPHIVKTILLPSMKLMNSLPTPMAVLHWSSMCQRSITFSPIPTLTICRTMRHRQ